MPDADDLAALARSSPWRWTTLRFTLRPSVDHAGRGDVRAWLRRPDALRVETVTGALLQVGRDPVVPDGWGSADDCPDRSPGQRRPRWSERSFDAPMYQDYAWVAMLDPVEFADGYDDRGRPAGPPLVIDSVTEVLHGGRPAWEAVVRTTPHYDPRCGCCPLLRDWDVAVREASGAAPGVVDLGDRAGYPGAHRIRLDAGTGVCVLTEELGGDRPGAGHDLRIEAVDEPMSDALFTGSAPRDESSSGRTGPRTPAEFLERARSRRGPARPGRAPGPA